jgi:hypothetical protein
MRSAASSLATAAEYPRWAWRSAEASSSMAPEGSRRRVFQQGPRESANPTGGPAPCSRRAPGNETRAEFTGGHVLPV